MVMVKSHTLASKVEKDTKSMKVIGLTISRMGMVVICLQTGQFIPDNGNLVIWKVKARSLMQMALVTKVTGFKT